jgi:hypothetical protein
MRGGGVKNSHYTKKVPPAALAYAPSLKNIISDRNAMTASSAVTMSNVSKGGIAILHPT